MSFSPYTTPEEVMGVTSALLSQLTSVPTHEGIRLLVEQMAAYAKAPDTLLYLCQDLAQVLRPNGHHPESERRISAVLAWAETLGTGLHDAAPIQHEGKNAAVLRDKDGLIGVLILPIEPAVFSSAPFSILLGLLNLTAAKLRAEDARTRYIQNQDQFVTDFVHDLRTPMTVVKSTADIVDSGLIRSGDTTYSKMLKRIMANIDAISELLEHVFVAGIYDPDTGKYTLIREAVDLEGIIGIIGKNLTPTAQKKGLTLTIDLPHSLPILSADKSMLTRAITNLVDNAVKYTNEGEVTVKAERVGEAIVISVRDTGVGLGEEAKRHVFDKFYRDNNRKHNNIKGTGLGLFIVHSTAVHHGGRAWVESEVDKGSTFYLSLPLRAPEPAAPPSA
jgi:signal transduction histidine kinase